MGTFIISLSNKMQRYTFYLYLETAVDAAVCAPGDGWKYHPKHVEQFLHINKLCNVASCWIYVGILLGAHQILHITYLLTYSMEQSPS
jgi:hypothetical protein